MHILYKVQILLLCQTANIQFVHFVQFVQFEQFVQTEQTLDTIVQVAFSFEEQMHKLYQLKKLQILKDVQHANKLYELNIFKILPFYFYSSF